MSTNTAKLILKRHGLLCFDIRELADIRRHRLTSSLIKEAITTLQEENTWTRSPSYGF